jgi:hypothetical protein
MIASRQAKEPRSRAHYKARRAVARRQSLRCDAKPVARVDPRATPAKNSALTSAGVELRFANGVTLIGKFDGEFASHSSTYAGTGTVRYM